MGPKRAKLEELSDSSDCSKSNSNEEVMEEDNSCFLKSIDDKLSLILTAINDLSAAIAKNNNTAIRKDDIVADIKSAVHEISQNIPKPEISVNHENNEENNNIFEREALKIKMEISNIWHNKMEIRKSTYLFMIKNKGHFEKYSKWLRSTPMVIPKHLQKKEIPNENIDQKSVRERAVLNDFNIQTELQSLRASSNCEKFKRIDEEIFKLINSKCNGRTARTLVELWKTETQRNEEISHKRWGNNEKWLSKYEEEFIKEHENKNPFFKKQDFVNKNQPSSYADAVRKNTTNYQNLKTTYNYNSQERNTNKQHSQRRNLQQNQTSCLQNIDVESIVREVLLKINNTNIELHNNFQRNNSTSNRSNIRDNTRSSYRRNYRNNNNTSDDILQDNDDKPSEFNVDFLEGGREWSSPT
ncbi:hypothetical protein DPMN_140397 [Dreissena polymorpha]|uniref:Uncharacterized protein n=2 Tax=Dreissena polymorpha TaxID=45954 RepID=A0A9D4GAW3_DREPO|nr:hypothetical protein DPMN_140397 [Dreissena polymorpha]